MAVSKMLTKQKGPSIMVERPIKYICQYVSFKRANSYTIVGDDDMHQITQLWLKNQFKGSAIVGFNNIYREGMR